MRAAPPEEFETSTLIDVLPDGWGFDVEAVHYAAVGGGSYHWVVEDVEGKRGFVTADDLDQKPWLGDTHESAFDGLRRAFETAVALRDGGLDFVVAPIPTTRGEAVRRIGPGYTIALFPFVDGQTGTYGHYETAERAALLTTLAELHRAPVVGSVTSRVDLDLPGRRRLEAALRELSQTWSAGPFSERARKLLAPHASDVVELLALSDRLSIDVARRSTDWVVTHGEPHGGNVMRVGESHVLVDWDTVALAPPERDLWMLVGDNGEEANGYSAATGHEVDAVAMNFFRLRWDLADIAAFSDLLRSPHGPARIGAFPLLQVSRLERQGSDPSCSGQPGVAEGQKARV
ncbi:MAG: aminoglycoside phosphotransferase family protein [Actinomycetota bacterium]|nr:aminoglycoside phosphotransferase family protein [Actinomycetota bacterium]